MENRTENLTLLKALVNLYSVLYEKEDGIIAINHSYRDEYYVQMSEEAFYKNFPNCENHIIYYHNDNYYELVDNSLGFEIITLCNFDRLAEEDKNQVVNGKILKR